VEGCPRFSSAFSKRTILEVSMQPEKKRKKIKELFVQDLSRIQEGRDEGKPSKRQPFTTLSCREEACG
jgi:nitrous oxide reductase accessory protein NosL